MGSIFPYKTHELKDLYEGEKEFEKKKTKKQEWVLY